MHFRPAPVLTIITLLGLAILISLGTWQYKRLQWKTGLLAEIDIAAEAQPLSSLADVARLLDDNEPVDFRRISMTGSVVGAPVFYVFDASDNSISWRVFVPLQQSGQQVFVDFETRTDAQKSDSYALEPQEVNVVGYVRLARETSPFATPSTPEQNRWFGFNPMPETHNWANDVNGSIDMRFYIDREISAASADELPVRKPDIRNNHFDYMLTWYGLALVLLVFYFLIHIRDGRLRW